MTNNLNIMKNKLSIK